MAMTNPPSLADFLQTQPGEVHRSSALRRSFDALGMDTSSALYAKALRIIHAIEGLFEQYGELKRDHAEWIQGWVLESLDRAEFKRMAQIIFEHWATPDRLEGPGIPHIHKANDAIG